MVGSKTANPRKKYLLTLVVTVIHPRQPLAAFQKALKRGAPPANHVDSLIGTLRSVNRNLLGGQVGTEQVDQPAG